MEQKLRDLLGDDERAQSAPVRLSSTELQAFLSQIDGYFQVEYQILLRQAAELTALSIIYAGDLAPERLREMKELGFQGLGRIEPVSFDRILWLFISITVGGFRHSLCAAVRRIEQGARRRSAWTAARHGRLLFHHGACCAGGLSIWIQQEVCARTTHPVGRVFCSRFDISCAVRNRPCGATIAGWKRRLCARPSFAALSSVAMGRNPLRTDAGHLFACQNEPLAHADWLPTYARRASGLGTIFWDGAAIAFLMFLAYSGAIILHDVLNVPLPGSLREAPYDPKIYLPLLLFGFLIGCVAARDARQAGLATIVERARPIRADYAGTSHPSTQTEPEPVRGTTR